MNNTKDIPTVPLALAPPRFANPFQGLKGDPTAATVNCLMPKEAFVRVKQCRLEGGTIQTTMNLLWIKLINLLEQKGIYGYESVREFEDAVQRSILILPEDLDLVRGRPTEGTNAAANVGDVAGGVEHVRNAVEGQQVVTDVPGDASKGGTKGNKRRTKRSENK